MELAAIFAFLMGVALLAYVALLYAAIVSKAVRLRLKAYEGRLIDFIALNAALILAIAGRPLAKGIYVSYATIAGGLVGAILMHTNAAKRLGVVIAAISLASFLRPVGPVIAYYPLPLADLLSAYVLSYLTARVSANLAYFGQPNRPKLNGLTYVYLVIPAVVALRNSHVAALLAMAIGIMAERKVVPV